jgi:hypothetical protein
VTWWLWLMLAAWLTLSVTIGLATAALLDRHYLNDPTDEYPLYTHEEDDS